MNILTKYSVGQYVDGNRSWLRIIDSRLKIIAVLIFLLSPIWAGPIWRVSMVITLLLITFLTRAWLQLWPEHKTEDYSLRRSLLQEKEMSPLLKPWRNTLREGRPIRCMWPGVECLPKVILYLRLSFNFKNFQFPFCVKSWIRNK